MSDGAVIKVRGLTVRYGQQTVLEEVSFDVRRGEILVILGASGCGKTTLMRHMIGLELPEKGEVLYGDKDIVSCSESERDEMQRSFGVLFQSGALFKSMTLGENVAMPLHEAMDMPDRLVRQLVRMKLAAVNLHGSEGKMPSELSGGMQKRGGLARAIALDPRIMFFDEPSAGLDPITSAGLDELILGINDSMGTTMVVVTHELSSIFRIATRVIMLDSKTHGIIAEGHPKELRDNPEHPTVKAFFHREALEEQPEEQE